MPRSPLDQALYTEEDVHAVKAVADGNASPGQQKRALEWIIRSAAMTFDETFVVGHQDGSSYLAGRRNVGLQIVKLINVPIGKLKPLAPASQKERN